MQIKVYHNVSEMTGIGEEWLVDKNGNIRAVFIDGNFRCSITYLPNTGKTKIAS